MMLNHPPRRRLRWPLVLIVPLALSLLFLAGWLAARTVLGDRWWWLFLLNVATPYLLLPLALLMALALRCWLSVALSVALLAPGAPILLDVWMPSFSDDLEFNTPAITVMTSNLYGSNDQAEPVIAAIRAAKADVVALQELNPAIAAALQRELAGEYPFQLLDPRAGVTGMGVFSRWSLQPLATSLPGEHWVGTPQLLQIAAPLGEDEAKRRAIGARRAAAGVVGADRLHLDLASVDVYRGGGWPVGWVFGSPSGSGAVRVLTAAGAEIFYRRGRGGRREVR
ncbi:endonuclease/exonuclease/phosphatase family protein [Chloroflexus sp.]|uniref:endonuclease/exonuclease/phosphatase family protein n=1 Tax=Chloroflexus sp. TaxID=1904827 RepID=UPI002ACDD71C|nr:endonuclease/exonuclease/phosphatase family protein [Chloroflexus sp.]